VSVVLVAEGAGMTLFPTLTERTPGPLRFVLGEIDTTLPDGRHVRADVFPRGDGRVSWSARVTQAPPPGHDGGPLPSESTGPHLVDDEATAEREALGWIRGQLR
jgi:hypothetical protein